MLPQVIYPLLFTGMLFKVDIKAVVTGGGTTSQAGAIRVGISRALADLLPEEAKSLDLAGLIRTDRRFRERKKPGKAGARRSYTWRKR